MNEDYIERYSLERSQYIANLIAIYKWMDKQSIQGSFIEIQNDVAAEIVKQLPHLRKILKDG